MRHGPAPKTQEFLPHLLTLARDTVPPMHPAGRPFVLGGALCTMALRRFVRPLWPLAALLTGWCAWFFREPRRVPPNRTGIVVAPADGTVSAATPALPPVELGLPAEPMLRVSIFLTIFDVHVQRIPVTGEITRIVYRPGKFLSADLDKASDDNERNTVLLRTDDGHLIPVVQIAGLVARRIVCSVREGQWADIGKTYGLIRFGSRLDTYLPLAAKVLVEPGQRTIGGETVLAELPSTNDGPQRMEG